MEQIKITLLKTPIIGSAYKHWRRNQKIESQKRREYAAWLKEPYAQESLERLRSYQDKHKGERCFVIGNGPSLNKLDLSLLKNETTFGANRLYLLFEELGFTSTYYCAVNPNVTRQFVDDIDDLPMPKFLTWHAHDHISFTDKTMFLRYIHEEEFHPTPFRGLWFGATVTFVSLQLAYFMGFETVYLIGVDHSFKGTGSAHQLVASQGDDENHFHPDYFGKGVEWQLPDLDTSEQAYLCARQYYEAQGRNIYDATLGGKLQIFPKVDFDSLF